MALLNSVTASTVVSGAEELDVAAVKVEVVVAPTEKATRPETTCPSELTNFQRAVIAPESAVGSVATTMLSDAP